MFQNLGCFQVHVVFYVFSKSYRQLIVAYVSVLTQKKETDCQPSPCLCYTLSIILNCSYYLDHCFCSKLFVRQTSMWMDNLRVVQYPLNSYF